MASNPFDEILVSGKTTNSFSIRNFRAELEYNDIIPSHSYLVTFSPFSSRSETAGPLSNFISQARDTLVMRCESAILPGVNLMTMNDIRRYGYGPVENMPHGVIFNDMTLTYVVDKHGLLTKFYNDWMNIIVSHNTSFGGTNMDKPINNYGESSGFFSPYEVGYKDDYANYKMSVWVYDREVETVMEYEIYDVFPKNIMDTPVQWGEQDNYIRLQILMAFTDVRVRNAKVNEFTDLEKLLNPGFESLVGGFLSGLVRNIF